MMFYLTTNLLLIIFFIKDARNHLVSNITAFLKRVWEKYLTWICEENNVVLNMRISPRTLGKKRKKKDERKDFIYNLI